MAAVRLLLGQPDFVLRLIAGRRVEVNGRRPLLTAQVLMRLSQFAPFDAPHRNGNLERARYELNLAGRLAGAGLCPDVSTRDITVQTASQNLRLRRYEPASFTPRSPALVYFHGGGFVLGSIDTHDSVCRLLAEEAGVCVISVGYRLAPEHPFPAATEDAIAAYRYICSHSNEFNVAAHKIAVGGDSSGGNLAAVVAHAGARGDVPQPAFSLLLTPATDAVGNFESHRLFGSGFRLDRDEWSWYRAQYMPDPANCTDPRASVLYAEDLDDLPPTYIATCEFDPLRDEGEAYAQRLMDAGVHVALHRHEGQLHGFVNRVGLDSDSRAALIHAARALRKGLTVEPS